MVAGVQEGITVVDAERRFVYANPAACEVLGVPLEQLRGRDFLDSIPAPQRTFALARFSERRGRSLGDSADPFTGVFPGPDGTEREIVCSTFPIDIAGSQHGVTIFQDVTATRVAARTAAALAQTTAQLVGIGTTDEILAGIARHAVEGTRALASGIVVVGDDHKLASGGCFGPRGLEFGDASPAWSALAGAPGEEVIKAMTVGSAVPGKPVVLADARSAWEASPVMSGFAVTLSSEDWRGAVCVPLSWENRVIGMFGVYLPTGLPGPNETELAFYTALADKAAVAVTTARLTAQAREAATFVERTRLARELHDSVSQALFSMTMHARAAQLSMAHAGVDESVLVGHSIVRLVELTQGAMAEMRSLIFELRPESLAEEGLVAALAKQGAALTARDQVAITVEGPEQRLKLSSGTEEHLYRIVSEALHNVAKHARADRATVRVIAEGGRLAVTVSDDGVGFDPDAEHPGHIGLSTMAQRAEATGAEFTVTSAPGAGTMVTISLPCSGGGREKAAPGAR